MAPGLRTADPRAPDGGWGWWVVFASFVQQALSIGVTYTFGVLLVDLLRYFDEKESTMAWIGSIQPCLLYFTGKNCAGRKVSEAASCVNMYNVQIKCT